MVANLTLGKPKYVEHDQTMRTALEQVRAR
ncbi:MAG: cyclodeaminase/cyclohydrolase family protein, partial [Nevskiales bacterium]